MPGTLEERIERIEEQIRMIAVAIDVLWMADAVTTIEADAVYEYEFPEGYGEGLGSLSNDDLLAVMQELDDLSATTPQQIEVMTDEELAAAIERAGINGWEGTD